MLLKRRIRTSAVLCGRHGHDSLGTRSTEFVSEWYLPKKVHENTS